MDAARLAAIRAREQAASPGPWRVVGGSGFEIYAPYDEDARQYGALDMFIASCDADARSHPNAAFIAAARSDVSDLLAEVERLQLGLRLLRAQMTPGLSPQVTRGIVQHIDALLSGGHE